MESKNFGDINTNWVGQLSESAIQLRKEWLSFSEEDEALVREIDPLIEENIDPMMDDMYTHFLSFPQTGVFFPDEDTLRRAQSRQKTYFLRIAKGNYNQDYVAERLMVGSTHYRIGLDPTWYLGAYNRVMSWLRQLVYERYGSDPEKFLRIISALNRLIFFDMGLAIDAYSIAKEHAIREQRDAIAELEVHRRVTKDILDGAPSGIIRLDRQFVCVECNQEFLGMNGAVQREDVVGQYIFAIAPGLPAAALEEVVTSGQPLKRSAEELQLQLSTRYKSTFFDWSVWPIKDSAGAISGLVATFTDVTGKVLLQQQREDFVATLTHDLKTPILAANRAIKLLIEGDFGQVLESQKQILETIYESNSAMYKMVQTLLDVYRYDSGVKQLQLAPQDLCKTILSIVKELQPLAGGKGIDLKTEFDSRCIDVLCDGEEIRRVVQNLLDNALKFTPSGGTIVVRMEQSQGVTRVSVHDTGKGITPEDKPKLFQRFWAASGSGRYYASTGLGLYLCSKIIELHGGRIWCESEVGKGSVFSFIIDQSDIQNRQRTSNELL